MRKINGISKVIAMVNGKTSIEVIPDKKSTKIIMTVLNQSLKDPYYN